MAHLCRAALLKPEARAVLRRRAARACALYTIRMAHSALIPAALITAPHFATSASWCDLSAAGVASSAEAGITPRLANLSVTFGSLSASCKAAAIFPTTSADVPLGAHSPCHAETSKPARPDSFGVGKSG